MKYHGLFFFYLFLFFFFFFFFFEKLGKMSQNLSSAAVLTGALELIYFK